MPTHTLTWSDTKRIWLVKLFQVGNQGIDIVFACMRTLVEFGFLSCMQGYMLLKLVYDLRNLIVYQLHLFYNPL